MPTSGAVATTDAMTSGPGYGGDGASTSTTDPGVETSSGTESTGFGSESSTSGFSTSTTGPGSDEKTVFITSTLYVGGSLGGLDNADARCQDRATKAGLDGDYRAWLSDSTGSPSTRMSGSGGSYHLVDGTLVAEGWDGLLGGELLHAIDLTEFGDGAVDTFICMGGEMWTNTTIDGELRHDAQHCGNWSNTMELGTTGNFLFEDAYWTASPCTNVTCSSALALYCIEQ